VEKAKGSQQIVPAPGAPRDRQQQQQQQNTPPGSPRDRQQQQTELAALSARALARRAEEAGVDDAQIEAADEAADRRGALTALILERHAEQTRAEAAKLSRLRAELAGLSARALARRAEDMGVGEAQLDAADDAADRKAALMELIMGRVQQPAARGGGGPSDLHIRDKNRGSD
jgi:hypothetical protein